MAWRPRCVKQNDDDGADGQTTSVPVKRFVNLFVVRAQNGSRPPAPSSLRRRDEGETRARRGEDDSDDDPKDARKVERKFNSAPALGDEEWMEETQNRRRVTVPSGPLLAVPRRPVVKERRLAPGYPSGTWRPAPHPARCSPTPRSSLQTQARALPCGALRVNPRQGKNDPGRSVRRSARLRRSRSSGASQCGVSISPSVWNSCDTAREDAVAGRLGDQRVCGGDGLAPHTSSPASEPVFRGGPILGHHPNGDSKTTTT